MGVSAAVVGSAVVGGMAANSAAGKQASAANNAADAQAQAAAQARADTAPYSTFGQKAMNPLMWALGYEDSGGSWAGSPDSPLLSKFSFDSSDLENTPGYQFTRDQGLKSIQNQMSSQGLGLSGAQIKGATGYATGLANQTYGDQYNRALSTWNTNYQSAANNANRLMNVVGLGANAAAQQGQFGMQGANNAGNYQTQAGNAQASGIMGTANALNTGVGNYMTYNALYGKPSNPNSFGSQAGNYLTS